MIDSKLNVINKRKNKFVREGQFLNFITKINGPNVILCLLGTRLPKYKKVFLLSKEYLWTKNWRSKFLITRLKFSRGIGSCKGKGRNFNESPNSKSPCNETKLDKFLDSNSFWKTFIPQILNNKNKLKTVWTKPTGEDIPMHCRGFKDKTGELCKPEISEMNKVNPRKVINQDMDIIARSKQFKKAKSQAYDPVTLCRQRILASDLAWTEMNKRKRAEEEFDLPPPRRCRLSCPLPPIEFSPSGINDIFCSHTKFYSHPGLFMPSEKKTTSEKDSTKVRNNFLLPRINNGCSKSWKSTLSWTSGKTYSSAAKSFQFKQDTKYIPQMKALVFAPATLGLEYVLTEAPAKIFKDEVLVQVAYSGVCGTDIFITEGKMPCGAEPIILGHEISGTVYAAGSDVQQVKVGDRVVINPYSACGICRYCTRGLFAGCTNEGLNNTIGVYKNGGWAEFVVVKKTQIHKVPSELGLDKAVLIHPVSCILSALNKLDISPGTDVVIQGLGLVGCLWASVLHSQNLKNVVVSDKSHKKRKQYEMLNLGFEVVDYDRIGKCAADVVIECTGSASSIEKCLKILNPNGQMCFFGKPDPTAEFKCWPYEIIRKEIKLIGSRGNAFCFSKAIDLASALGSRYLDLQKLGVRTFDLQEFKNAFQLKKFGEIITSDNSNGLAEIKAF